MTPAGALMAVTDAPSRDGQRFLVMLPVPTGLSPLRVVSGWQIDSRTRSSTGTR